MELLFLIQKALGYVLAIILAWVILRVIVQLSLNVRLGTHLSDLSESKVRRRISELAEKIVSQARKKYGTKRVMKLSAGLKLRCVTNRRCFVFCAVVLEDLDLSDLAQIAAEEIGRLGLASIVVLEWHDRVLHLDTPIMRA